MILRNTVFLYLNFSGSKNFIILYNVDTNSTVKYLLNEDYDYKLIANIYGTHYIAVGEGSYIKIVNYIDCQTCYTPYDQSCTRCNYTW